MLKDLSANNQSIAHATLVFERTIDARVEQVFAAFSQVQKRIEWGAPSETTALIYDSAQFHEGGEDRFRCGSKANPNIHGTTRYLEIIENRRIVSSETIVVDGKRLCCSMTTLEFFEAGNKTHLKSTCHVASFIGQDMIHGHQVGTNSSLDNLVQYF